MSIFQKIEKLESINRDDFLDEIEALKERLEYEGDEIDPAEKEEIFDKIKKLERLEIKCARDFSDWDYGAPIFHESNFSDVCREIVEGCIGLPENFPPAWIDWETIEKDMRYDYSRREIFGKKYMGLRS